MELKDIHDIKPLEQIGIDPGLIRIAIYSFIALGVLLLLFLARYWWKKRKLKSALNKPQPLPPHETAFLSLDGLENISDISGQEFYFRLSAILRNYIEGRFGIHAPEMTTEELCPQIDGLGLSKEIDKQVKEFLRYSDPIKFAGTDTIESKMKQDMILIRQFVKQTQSSSSQERNA